MTSNGHGRRDVDTVIAAALAAGASYEDAATAAHVSKSTVKRRMGEPEFREAVAEARAEMAAVLRGRLLRAAPTALGTLEELANGAESESVRLGAARSLVAFACERRPDPFADALRAAGSISPRDFRDILEKVVDAALGLIPDEQQDHFMLCLGQISTSR
jgi:hypothetical protein